MSNTPAPRSATGRRKSATARVLMTPGTGKITVNEIPFEEYFATLPLQNTLLSPFQKASLANKFDLVVIAKGGGLNGQADAAKLAVSRALLLHDPGLRPALKEAGLLRRDPRMKERKKAGQPGARKRFQFSKR